MVTRIVHISDLHFPSRSRPVADELQAAIVRARPHILAVTGDLANSPSLLWWREQNAWQQTRGWIEAVVAALPDVRVLVLPGNHDVLVTGLFGWCWPYHAAFRRALPAWQPSAVSYFPERNLTLLGLDTNPLGALGSAEGKALTWRLNRMRRALEQHGQAAAIRTSTKVLLMHHHPLPVPHQGSDVLLHTRRVDRLLRFLAEQRIDLVLHGHKHHASWSHLRLGGSSEEPHFIETLGAGSAMKDERADPRGHNFNIVDVSTRGVRQVRQYFKPYDGQHFEESPRTDAEAEVDRLIQVRFRQPYRARTLSWALTIDPEGDGYNCLEYQDIVFNKPHEPFDLELFIGEVESGEMLPYANLVVTPGALSATFVPPTEPSGRTRIRFAPQPTESMHARATVTSYDLNCYSLDQREASDRGLKDPTRDYLDLLLRDPVEEFRLQIRFPSAFRPANSRIQVFEPHDDMDVVHHALTASVGSQLHVEANTLDLRLSLPQPNVRYRISWALPAAADLSEDALGRRTVFEQQYLALVAETKPPASVSDPLTAAIALAVAEFQTAVEAAVRARLGAIGTAPLFGPLDLSMMVCERLPGSRPLLRLVFWNREGLHKDVFRTVRLAIGEGNAGRAYKSSTARRYNAQQAAANPKANTFAQKGGPGYAFLLSVPILDRSGLPLAILNVGTGSTADAALLALTEDDITQVLARLHGNARAALNAAGLTV